MSSYSYTLGGFVNVNFLTSTLGRTVNIYQQRLINEIKANFTVPTLQAIDQNSTNVIFYFTSALSGPQQTTLNSIVANHPNKTITPPIDYSNFSPNSLALTDPNYDETRGYYAGQLWYNFTLNNLNNKLSFCIDGYPGDAKWLNLPLRLNQMFDVSIPAPNNTNVLAYNSTLQQWTPFDIQSIIPSAGSIFLSNGGSKANTGKFVGQGNTNTQADNVEILSSFNIVLGDTVALYGTFDSITTSNRDAGRMYLAINGISSSLYISIAGGSGIGNGYNFITNITLDVYDRISLFLTDYNGTVGSASWSFAAGTIKIYKA